MWFDEGVFYQIYPLGYCGAERQNDFGDTRRRLGEIEKDIERIKELGFTAVLFNPLFESVSHGYDTIDFYKIDRRLGTNEDFAALVKKFHEAGIKVVLDGVFNHVGRGFAPFKEVLEKREETPYRFWFNVNFYGNNGYNDGLSYENWEGHDELVKLRLDNQDVQNYLMDAVRFWIDEFDIDGLRLDVSYLLPQWFFELLRRTVREKKNDFFLMGEVIHIQNFAQNITPERLDSITNYECFKGMNSAVNSDNLNEIEYSLNRLFGSFNWCLYTGKHLFNFVDNHDVVRAYTALGDKRKIYNLYGILFTMPGIPCVYYGSECGAEGDKGRDDSPLRPAFKDIALNKTPELTEFIKKIAHIKRESRALNYGGYNRITVSNKYMAYSRECDGEKMIACFNISDSDVYINAGGGRGKNLLTESECDLYSIKLSPFEFALYKAI